MKHLLTNIGLGFCVGVGGGRVNNEGEVEGNELTIYNLAVAF